MILGLDPLFLDGVDGGDVAWVVVKVLVTFVFLLVAVMLNIWFLRKVIADFQNRIGPSVAGPWGILQSLADGIKLFMKEDLVPAFLVFAIVPLGGDFNETRTLADGTIETGSVEWGSDITYLQLADPPVGILFFLAMSSLAIYGIMLAGWGSGSKYPLLGSVRASAQMVSYEAALGLAIAVVVLVSGSLSTHDIVVQQASDGWFGFVPRWNLIVTAFVPFVIFLIAGTAELNHPPFDLVEAEQELVGGFHTEYSSIRFGMFFVAEFMHPVTMSAVIVTLWFGGPAGPLLPGFLEPVSGIFWLVAKIFVFLYIFVLIRGTLPRFRYDQLMDLGWKVLIPLQLGWLLLLASLNIGRDLGWNYGVVIGIGFFLIGGTCFALLARASEVSRQRRELGEVEA